MPTVTTMPRPAQDSASREFMVSDWRPFAKNTLLGFLSLTTPSGLILNGCTYHAKGTAKWIGMPAQKFTKEDGSVSYTPILDFNSKSARDRFQSAAVRAVERFLAGGSAPK